MGACTSRRSFTKVKLNALLEHQMEYINEIRGKLDKEIICKELISTGAEYAGKLSQLIINKVSGLIMGMLSSELSSAAQSKAIGLYDNAIREQKRLMLNETTYLVAKNGEELMKDTEVICSNLVLGQYNLFTEYYFFLEALKEHNSQRTDDNLGMAIYGDLLALYLKMEEFIESERVKLKFGLAEFDDQFDLALEKIYEKVHIVDRNV